MFSLGKFAFDLISGLIWDVIKDGLKSSSIDFFQERKIKSRVEDATAEVIKDVLPFLEQEKIPQDKQQRLVETCVSELKPFVENPSELFKGSLDGQKIFDNLYHDKDLPQVIIEDQLKNVYSLLFPRIATLLCKIPAAVKDWENEAWSENYRRLDEVAAQLKSVFAQVDELATTPQKGADKTLTLLKRSLTQKVGLQLDITGLRADQPLSGKFDDFFVLPEIREVPIKEKADIISISDSNECFCNFTKPHCLSIIIGAPGVGKSTWSKWLQRESLKADWAGIGIRVEFKELTADDLPSIYDLIRKAAGKQLIEDLTPEKIRRWVENCQIVFILDGFDEIKPIDRNKYAIWIDEISNFARGCPFVITSRPITTNHLEKLGKNWKQWTIEPFDDARIISYISKWYAHTPLLTDASREVDAVELSRSWQNDLTIRPLTNNPLLLSTLLMVHHLDGKLPNGRANLYKRYVDGLLGVWDERHKLTATDIQLNPAEKRKILRGMALHFFLTERETIDETDLIKWLKDFLPSIGVTSSPADVLLVLRERTGLIVGPGVYNFSHKTISEYLVGETVLQGDQKDLKGERIDRFRLLEHRDDDRWNMVLFLWAGISPAIDLVAFIEQSIYDHHQSLAYGILVDQYERVPVETRKELILKNNELKQFQDMHMSWGISGWPVKNEFRYAFPVPSGSFISLSGRQGGYSRENIQELLRTAINDGTILWSDVSEKKGALGELVFLLFITTPTKDWEKALNIWREKMKEKREASYEKQVKERTTGDSEVKDWKQYTESEWSYFIACRIFSWPFFEKNLDPGIFYKTYKNYFPQSNGYVAFAMMSSFIEMSESEFKKPSKTLFAKYIDFMHNYGEKDIESISREYLVSTKRWKLWTRYFHNRQSEYDLFAETKKSIEKSVALGVVESNENVQQVLAFIDKLSGLRNQLS